MKLIVNPERSKIFLEYVYEIYTWGAIMADREATELESRLYEFENPEISPSKDLDRALSPDMFFENLCSINSKLPMTFSIDGMALAGIFRTVRDYALQSPDDTRALAISGQSPDETVLERQRHAIIAVRMTKEMSKQMGIACLHYDIKKFESGDSEIS